MELSIWKTLSTIDCNEHVDKKGQFSYLSWTWAWAMVKERYPFAVYTIEPDITYPDKTMEVRCTVTIDNLSHTMWLPVLDFKNRAIVSPNAFDVNSSRMRCLVKCLAMFGLGHYIYAGESLPTESITIAADPYTPDQLAHFNMLVASEDGWGILKFSKEVPTETLGALFNSAPKGEKVRLKEKCRALAGQANNHRKAAIQAIHEALLDGSITAIDEVFGELPVDGAELVMAGLTEIELMQIDNLRGGEL